MSAAENGTGTAEIRGSCHCGAVKFEVRLTDGLASARRCNCSICAMRGAVAVTAPLGGIEILEGADMLTLYRFGTNTAEHYFCARCGIYTHHRRRSNPDELGINLACLEGHTPFLPEVIVGDGRNHSKDTAVERRAGRLIFIPEGDAP